MSKNKLSPKEKIMRERKFNKVAGTALLFIITISILLFGNVGTVAYAAGDTVTITYYYQDNVITTIPIPRGGKILSTISYEDYSEEITLAEGYILIWHIGSEDGVEWDKDYIFTEDTALFGVAIEGEEEIIKDPPDGNNNNEEENVPNDNNQEGITPPTAPEQTKYIIKIENVKGAYKITGEPIKGEHITVYFDQGYLLSDITAFSGDKEVDLYKSGNEVKFYMPKGDVTIRCCYKEESENTKKLTKNEIIALAVVGGCAISYGIFLIIKKAVKQRIK